VISHYSSTKFIYTTDNFEAGTSVKEKSKPSTSDCTIEVKNLTNVVKLLLQVMDAERSLNELNWDRLASQQVSCLRQIKHISASIEQLTNKTEGSQQLTEELIVETNKKEWSKVKKVDCFEVINNLMLGKDSPFSYDRIDDGKSSVTLCCIELVNYIAISLHSSIIFLLYNR
jgi:hypothetical protein